MYYVALWSGLGLIGTALIVSKSARKGSAVAGALFSLPHAIIFGPLFLLMMLAAGPPLRLCPFCKSSIPRNATVCSECTRDVAE